MDVEKAWASSNAVAAFPKRGVVTSGFGGSTGLRQVSGSRRGCSGGFSTSLATLLLSSRREGLYASVLSESRL